MKKTQHIMRLFTALFAVLFMVTGLAGCSRNASGVPSGAMDPDDPAWEEILTEISGDYFLTKINDTYNLDAPYDSIMLFSDATAAVYMEGYEALDEFYDFTYNGSDIRLQVNGEEWAGTLKDGIMTLQMNGGTYVFAMEETQTYETWLAMVEGGEEYVALADAAGFYRLTEINEDGTRMSVEELAAKGYGDTDNYLILLADETGYLSYMYSVQEFSWDEDTIWFDYDWEEYTINGDTLTLTHGEDGFLTFAKSNDTPPEIPEIMDAEGLVEMTNPTELYFDEVILVPGSWDFEDAVYWTSIEPEETLEIDLYDTGATFPGRFHMSLYQADANCSYIARYVELYDGYEIEIAEQGGKIVFLVRDASGNVRTVESEVVEETGYDEDTGDIDDDTYDIDEEDDTP